MKLPPFLTSTLCLFVFTFGVIFSNDLLAQGTNAEECIVIDKAAGAATNTCDEPVEFFYCFEGACGGRRYYGEWVAIEPHSSFKVNQTNKISTIRFGACAGHYFTAAHTSTASYSCKQTFHNVVQTKAPIASGGSCKEIQIGPASRESVQPNKIVCSNGKVARYQLEIVKDFVLRIRIEDSPTITTINGLRYWDEAAQQYLIPAEKLSAAICAAPSDPYFIEEISSQIKSSIGEPADRRKTSVCIGVRG